MSRQGRGRLQHATALAGAVVVAIALAGCGGNEDDSRDSTVAAGGSAPTATAQSGGGAQTPAEFGEEADAADRTAAGASVQEFLRAFAADDWPTACSLMSAFAKENLAVFTSRYAQGRGCPAQMQALTRQVPAKRLPQPGRIEVIGLRIDGDRGFVLYRDAEGARFAFPVAREGGEWRVAAIVGTDLG